MADVFDQVKRSAVMAAIKGKGTKPELTVRRFLHSLGYRFRLHGAKLPGRPDIVLPRLKTVVFVHGCFWHQHRGCRFAVTPKTNVAFWSEKLGANSARDVRNSGLLRRLGWRVITVWECRLGEKGLRQLARRLAEISAGPGATSPRPASSIRKEPSRRPARSATREAAARRSLPGGIDR
jgi:DNA mismatch endonuclease, patch repair protein